MKLGGMSNRDDVPEDFPLRVEEQQAWFNRLVQRVVDRVWSQPSPEDLRVLAEEFRQAWVLPDGMPGEEFFPFCFCHKGETLYKHKQSWTIARHVFNF